jgi:hypothetical protein
MDKSLWTPAELDTVVIPEATANEHGVIATGTIVWHVAGAPYATVECTEVNGRPGLDTQLVDVPLNELRLDRD